MPRWSLVLLLAVGVLAAGIGVGLTGAFAPWGAASFGWTAYSPLSATTYSGGYQPIDTTWLIWGPRVGVTLLALGAGATGAALVALVTRRPRATPDPEPPQG